MSDHDDGADDDSDGPTSPGLGAVAGLGLAFLDQDMPLSEDGGSTGSYELASSPSPPVTARKRHEYRDDDEPTTPPRIASPSIPSPLSLYHLGLTPLSPLRRQLSSPLAVRPSSSRKAGVGPHHHHAHGSGEETMSREGLLSDEDEAEDAESVTRHRQEASNEEARRDVLAQRLTDLAQRVLASGSSGGDDDDGLDEEAVSALHAKVGEMERLLASRRSPRTPRRVVRPSWPPPLSSRRGGDDSTTTAADGFWISPSLSPSVFRARVLDVSSSESTTTGIRDKSGAGDASAQAISEVREETRMGTEPLAVDEVLAPLPELRPELDRGLMLDLEMEAMPQLGVKPGLSDEEMTSAPMLLTEEEVKRIADDAGEINEELEMFILGLRHRQEEIKHLHELLMMKATHAADRVQFLQDRVKSLEEELQENDSELSYLRLGLKAIEVQVPTDVDSELVESINNWKMDWVKLKQKRNEKRLSERGIMASPSVSKLL